MKKQAIVWAICGLVVAAMAGCHSDNARDLKREQDRLAIDLSRVQKERDQYRARLQQTQAATSDTDKKLQNRVDDLEAQLKVRDDELTELRRRLHAAEAAAQPTLPTSRGAQP